MQQLSSFEQWQQRPVYKAQTKTWDMAGLLDVCCVRFRVFRKFRNAEAQHARDLVARAMRVERRLRPFAQRMRRKSLH